MELQDLIEDGLADFVLIPFRSGLLWNLDTAGQLRRAGCVLIPFRSGLLWNEAPPLSLVPDVGLNPL